MIKLIRDELCFSFSRVHPRAACRIQFQRTLRVPDDGNDYPLPAGLGRFPLLPIDRYRDFLPDDLAQRGGVLLSMYPSEALWINFISSYPMAVKVSVNGVNAVSGFAQTTELNRQPQDYLVIPDQLWLDGYSIAPGLIRQFVAVDAQSLPDAEYERGLRLWLYPMKGEFYEQLLDRSRKSHKQNSGLSLSESGRTPPLQTLLAGGLMRQDIYSDTYPEDCWDLDNHCVCCCHILNYEQFRQFTGHPPLSLPVSEEEYRQRGIPWFESYGNQSMDDPATTTDWAELANISDVVMIQPDLSEAQWKKALQDY